jgi:hypothetical protein
MWKKVSNKLKQWKNALIRAWKWVAGNALMVWYWLKCLFYLYISWKDKMITFSGWGHYWFAKQYADKRHRMTKNEVCSGRRFYVLPWHGYSLIVLNRDEILYWIRKGVYNKSMKIEKILKNAYYVTKDPNNKQTKK